jgi:LemA protein
MVLWIGLAVVAVIAVYLIALFNGLVGKRNRVDNAWSQIDVQLTRRHDLIPNLVSAVQGYMQHERAVLESVTRARAAAIAAGNDVTARADAENSLTRSMRSLFAVAEAYPALKADQNMLALQEELSSTESRIAFARQHYNDSVTEYNSAQQTFPAVLVAGMLGFSPRAFFALDDPAQRAVPSVRFC